MQARGASLCFPVVLVVTGNEATDKWPPNTPMAQAYGRRIKPVPNAAESCQGVIRGFFVGLGLVRPQGRAGVPRVSGWCSVVLPGTEGW